MKKEIVEIPGQPSPGYLSKVVRFGNLVFVAGTVGRDPATNELAGEDIRSQTRQTLENIKAGLESAGCSMGDVLKATCYLTDLKDKKGFDEVYLTYFPSDPPTRACVQVSALSPGVIVEVEVIAGIQD